MSNVAQITESKEVEPEPDFLENDSPIPGQNYVCLSFLSPESCIVDKQLFSMYKYLQENDLIKTSFENFKGEYEEYTLRENETIEKQFHEKNDFSTSVRGLKVRGVYDNVVEAKYRAKQLQRKDPLFNVFVGQVGFWLPWDPSPGEIQEQEYLNDQLNTLMKSYRQNQEHRDMVWQKNKERVMKKADTTENAENKGGPTNHQLSDAEQKLEAMEQPDPWMQQRSGASK